LRGADDPVKTTKLIAAFSVALLTVPSAQAQGTFQNLNFEQANPVAAGNPYLSYYVTTASALPGWSVYYGNVQQAQIPFDVESIGATWVVLWGPGFDPIDGNYSVLLQGGLNSSTLTPEPASISQTGLIPAGTQSLLFEGVPGNAPLDIYIGSQIVPYTAVGIGPNYTLYGANLSAWEGQTEQLTFSAPSTPEENNWEIDDIVFSTTPVPEPGIGALTAIGGLLFGARKRFARRS
jgi:hypothetical protein